MKKLIFAAGLAFAFLTVSAQETTDEGLSGASYIVKTRGAKKAAAAAAAEGEAAQEDEQTAHDFVSENFKFYSLCDWQEGMKFMVMPEKYDLIVNTFCDAATGKEVSSGSLRHKIMIYKGHTEAADGHARINFYSPETKKDYYYQVPNGSFDDYCYGKLGVPTLAYLGDVDIARTKLLGNKVFAKGKIYRVDTEAQGDGYEEVNVDEHEECTVTAIGVGTRSFPVKIIVEDSKGKEFYQCVAISKTNSGMRDDEFIMDNTKFTFNGSFELIDAVQQVSKSYGQYIGKSIYTKYATPMLTKGAGKERTVRVPRMMNFVIEAIEAHKKDQYVTLTLLESESRRQYFKDVTFVNVDNVTGDIDGRKEDYFGYLFAFGEAKTKNTNTATRAAIRQGRVIVGMTEDEVYMAVGEPDRSAESSNGRYDWIYSRTGGKWLIVQFGKAGKVIGTKVQR